MVDEAVVGEEDARAVEPELREEGPDVAQTNAQGEDVQRKGRSLTMNAQHNAMGAFDAGAARSAAAASPFASKQQGENVTVVRTSPKVGRNNPCPCGSGKKYKQCYSK